MQKSPESRPVDRLRCEPVCLQIFAGSSPPGLAESRKQLSVSCIFAGLPAAARRKNMALAKFTPAKWRDWHQCPLVRHFNNRFSTIAIASAVE
jgi:hypothetical protein